MGFKRFVPGFIKTPVRRMSDRLRRQGHFFEQQGRHDILHKAFVTLDFNSIPGDYAEFGCCGAVTFGIAAAALGRSPRTPRKLWAFDSFAGLPPPETADDHHPRWIPQTMKMELEDFHAACRRKGIRNYDVVVGYFSDTLRGRPASFFPPGSMALAFVDCDMYSSARDVCEFLLPRLQHGMMIAFDDYWCFSTTGLSGERRAFDEVLRASDQWHFEPYQPFGWSGMAFVAERRRFSALGP